jgi:hypothetical protein
MGLRYARRLCLHNTINTHPACKKSLTAKTLLRRSLQENLLIGTDLVRDEPGDFADVRSFAMVFMHMHIERAFDVDLVSKDGNQLGKGVRDVGRQDAQDSAAQNRMKLSQQVGATRMDVARGLSG